MNGHVRRRRQHALAVGADRRMADRSHVLQRLAHAPAGLHVPHDGCAVHSARENVSPVGAELHRIELLFVYPQLHRPWALAQDRGDPQPVRLFR